MIPPLEHTHNPAPPQRTAAAFHGNLPTSHTAIQSLFFQKPIYFCYVVSPIIVLLQQDVASHWVSRRILRVTLYFKPGLPKPLLRAHSAWAEQQRPPVRGTAARARAEPTPAASALTSTRSQAACQKLLIECSFWKQRTLSVAWLMTNTILNFQKNQPCSNFCCQLCELHEVISAKRGAWYGIV